MINQIITAADPDFEYFKGSGAALRQLSTYAILPRRAGWRLNNKSVYLLVSVINDQDAINNSTRRKLVLDQQSSTKFWIEQEDFTYYFPLIKASFLAGVIGQTKNKIRLSRRAETRLQHENKAAALGISYKRFLLNNKKVAAEQALKQHSGRKIELLVEMTRLRNKVDDTIQRVSNDTYRYEDMSVEKFSTEIGCMVGNLVNYSHQISTALENLIKLERDLERLNKEEEEKL